MLTVKPVTRASIRWMCQRDYPAVLAIEQKSFPDPWTESQFRKCFKYRNVIGLVAEDRYGVVVGYAVYAIAYDRIELLNLAVDPDRRRQGIGRQLVDKLKAKVGNLDRKALMLDVGEWNLGAQLFFRRQGFLAEELLRGHYERTGEDGYRMAYRVD